MNQRIAAILTGIFVTFLWSTSYILNKLAFEEGILPFTLSGMRYMTAAIMLWIFSMIFKRRTTEAKKHIKQSGFSIKIKYYIILGITGYIMAQGLQYAGQYFVTPTQTSLILAISNNTLVIFMDLLWLREMKNKKVIHGLIFVTAGILLYYYPWQLDFNSKLGILLIVLSSVGYVINLALNRRLVIQGWSVKDLIMIPMLIGAAAMLSTGVMLDGFPKISLKLAVIILWLGSINGAAAFYLWTWTQKRLQAFESSVLNNLVLPQVVLMDIIFFGRKLGVLQITGLIITLLAVAFVQLFPYMNSIFKRNK